jgi:hypothetical protein
MQIKAQRATFNLSDVGRGSPLSHPFIAEPHCADRPSGVVLHLLRDFPAF